MIFSVVVLLLVGAVAYFHYVQGFFSATLSTMICILSVAIAISFHEPLSRYMLGGKFTDQATGLALIILFLATYAIVRTIFDKTIPGNIRLPVLADKVGAGLMGLIAGVFSVGLLVIAAESLPFGPSIAGYARFAMIDKEEMQVSSGRSMQDLTANDVLKSDHLDPNDAASLLLPVDDIVMNTVRHLSDGGALAGAQNLSDVHPNYLNELFGQRLGVQTGAHHVAFNSEKDKQVELKGLYVLDSVVQGDGELTTMKGRFNTPLAAKLTTDVGNVLLVVRLSVGRNASDADNNIRISTGGTRLVYGGKDFYPVGTLQTTDGLVLRANRADDFLIVPADGIIEFVYNLKRDDFGLPADAKGKPADLTMPADSFIEAKRLGYIDLSGMAVPRTVPPSPAVAMLRKKGLPPAVGAPAGATPGEAAAGPLDVRREGSSSTIFTDIALGAIPAAGGDVTFRSGKATLRDGKMAKMEIDPTDSLTLLKQGEGLTRELWVPAGQKVVQLVAVPSSSVENKWLWNEKLPALEISDSNGNSYKPRGVLAKVKAGAADKLLGRWDAERPVESLPSNGELRPTDIWIFFIVPDNTTINDVKLEGKSIKKINVTAAG